MKTIHKYKIEITGTQKIKMPVKAKILSIQSQHDAFYMWALVDPEHDMDEREFHMYGTGHPVFGEDKIRFIETIQIHGGDLIFHVFENTGE